MAINIPLPAVQPTDIFDAFQKLAATHQARVASQFAQPNAQANLDRIKALITGQNLTNQTSQLKMPYVTQKEEADIGKTKAGTGYLQAETQMLPRKYDLEGGRLAVSQGRLGLDKDKFNRLQGQVKLNYLKSLPQKARLAFIAMDNDQQNEILGNYIVSSVSGNQNGAVSSGQPNAAPVGSNGANVQANPIQQLISGSQGAAAPQFPQGQPPNQPNPIHQLISGILGQSGDGAAANQPQPSQQPTQLNPQKIQQLQEAGNKPDALETFRNFAEEAANKSLNTTQLQNQKNAYEQMDSLLGTQHIEDILKKASKYAGLFGKGKKWMDAVAGQNSEDYDAFKEFQNILSTNYTNLTKRMEALAADNKTRAEIHNSLTGAINAWDSNPRRALKLFDETQSQLQKIGQTVESQAHKFNPQGKTFGPAPAKKLSESSMPTSHDPSSIKEWLKTASKEDINNYRNSLPKS